MSCNRLTPEDFARRWSLHLMRRFGERGEVAAAFGVSKRTADYWLEGEITPNGFTLWRYLRGNPAARADLFGEAP